MTLDTVSVIKDMNPISWNIAKSEWESIEADEEIILSFDNGSIDYNASDIESLLSGEE